MQNDTNIKFFTFFSLFWIGLGFLALILAILGYFYIPIIIGLAILAIVILIYLIVKNKKRFYLNWEFWSVSAFSLLAIILFSYYTTPSVFSGRDQGSFSNAAIILSQNHKLSTSFPIEREFFNIYGAGTALNFPGFNYDLSGNLISHFLPGYISWLAIFYSLFGLDGFIIANGISFFIFLLSFYFLSRNYLEKKSALIAFFLVITSFVFSWFFKFTLSENLALALIWFGLLQFILFLKENNKLFLVSFLLSFGFLAFIRIEAIAFLAVALLILFLKHKKNIFSVFDKKIILFIIALFVVFILSLKISFPFYTNVAKGFLNSFSLISKDPIEEKFSFLSENIYLWKTLWIYALAPYIIIGFLGFLVFLKNKKKAAILPYVILLPAFFYFINPSISLDHPWMLRRYLFAVIPASILYTVIFLDYYLKKKNIFYILSFILLLSNLIIFIPYITTQENENLLEQTKKLSANFQTSDLVLIDREASGSGFAMLAGPINLLYGKQAVYFFNPDDLKKINLKKFDKIYLIIPDKNASFYEISGLKNKLIPVKDYKIENDLLAGSSNELPIYQKSYTYGKIYLLKN